MPNRLEFHYVVICAQVRTPTHERKLFASSTDMHYLNLSIEPQRNKKMRY